MGEIKLEFVFDIPSAHIAALVTSLDAMQWPEEFSHRTFVRENDPECCIRRHYPDYLVNRLRLFRYVLKNAHGQDKIYRLVAERYCADVGLNLASGWYGFSGSFFRPI